MFCLFSKSDFVMGMCSQNNISKIFQIKPKKWGGMDHIASTYFPENIIVKSMALTYSMFSICCVSHLQYPSFVILVVLWGGCETVSASIHVIMRMSQMLMLVNRKIPFLETWSPPTVLAIWKVLLGLFTLTVYLFFLIWFIQFIFLRSWLFFFFLISLWDLIMLF